MNPKPVLSLVDLVHVFGLVVVEQLKWRSESSL